MRTKEKEMAIFLDKIFPQIQGRFEIAELYESGALVKMKIINDDLRPGNTVSGPSTSSVDKCVTNPYGFTGLEIVVDSTEIDVGASF